MEDKFADFIMKLKEAISNLIVLQQAIQNEMGIINQEHVDDSLEISIEKLKTSLNKANEIKAELFNN